MKKAIQARLQALANSKAVRAVAASTAMGVATGQAAAQQATTFTIDTTGIVGVITGGVTTISAIGIAVLSLVVVIKLFKWAQRVL